MKKLILALAIAAAPVQAFDWPWQTSSDPDFAYCKGFTFAGLAAFPVEKLSRTQLWLSWNHINRASHDGTDLSTEQYDAGKAKFASLQSSSDSAALLELANGECDFAEI
jgi:hypothetical protein